jgi:hypothetical protein
MQAISDLPVFGPPEPVVVDAIVNGTSPIMRALDQRQHAAAMA